MEASSDMVKEIVAKILYFYQSGCAVSKYLYR